MNTADAAYSQAPEFQMWDYPLAEVHADFDRLRFLSVKADFVELRDAAWDILRPLFVSWADYEAALWGHLTPQQIVDLRLSYRLRSELALFRFANFPDASRLLRKDFCDNRNLERQNETNPGAPPAMHAVYERVPRARGPYRHGDQTVIEALDHAALRIPCVDVVHHRTSAACAKLVPLIKNKLTSGHHFFLLDVACGGNRLGRSLREKLRASGLAPADLSRVHILGVDVDKRAEAFTYSDDGTTEVGWNDRSANDLDVTVVRGNLFDARTETEITAFMQRAGISGFDAVTALGIFDYFDCPEPDQPKVYIPMGFAAPLGLKMRSYAVKGGVVIAAVFAGEDDDKISTGARHLFANWHIKHANGDTFRSWFGYAKPEELSLIPGVAPEDAKRAHFVIHTAG